MWIDSGIHAREWITPAVNTWMLNELVENEDDHPDLLDKLDWYFLPLYNPDGYFRSRESDRLWRKTTSSYQGLKCQGTDANRNFGFHFGEASSSDNSCSEIYRGPSPFSEVENRNVANFLTSHKRQIKFFMSLHASSQMIMIPYGFSKNHVLGGKSTDNFLESAQFFLSFLRLQFSHGIGGEGQQGSVQCSRQDLPGWRHCSHNLPGFRRVIII